jgi:hypothetical protein
MAQSVIQFVKHAVAGSSRLTATYAYGGHGPVDIKITQDLDNGSIIGKGANQAGQVYAMAAPTTFTGKILHEKAANGNFYVEVVTASNAYLVLTTPTTYYDWTERMKAESTFYNANGDVVRAYPLFPGDIFELSAEGFDGTPAVDTAVTLNAAKYQVKVGS